MRGFIATFLLFFAAFGLAGCGTPASGCQDNAGCGDLQVCVQTRQGQPGICADVECVTNADCDLGEFCQPPDYTCEPGCDSDLDCRAGQTCNLGTNTCEEYGCRNTDLDCNYGEFCTNGTCVPDTAPHCDNGCDPFVGGSCGAGNQCVAWNLYASCNLINGDGDCPNGQYCGAFEIDESSSCNSLTNSGCPAGWNCAFFDLNGDGFGDGDYCYEGSCFDTRCLVGCGGPDDCPRGFSCGDIGLGSPLCFADCDFLDQWL